jgi:hypothetical protein
VDVYKIGIEISMANGVSAVLNLIQRQMLGLNKATQAAAAGFGRLRLAIAGATGMFVGTMMIKGLYDLSRHGEKYTHQLELMKTAGMGVVETQEAIAAANKVSSSVLTTTPAENLQTIRELRMALASADVRPGGKADPAMATKEAVAHLETFQKISGIMSSQLSKNGKTFDGSGQAYELAKAAEILGLSQDPKKFDEVLGGWTQAIIASGGKLQGSDFFANVKYMRGAGAGMSIEFLTKQLPPLMQELKAGRGSGSGGGAGNPLASMYASVVGGVMQKKTIEALQSIHMIDPTKVTYDHGRPTVKPGAVIGSGVEVKNPFEWAMLVEKNIAKYTNFLEKDKTTGEYTREAELKGLIAAIAPNRTYMQLLSMMLFQQNRMVGDRGLIESAWKVDPAYEELVRHDPDLARKAMSEQWDRLTTDLGKSIAPGVTDIIYKLAKGLAYLSEVIEAHPVATSNILIAVGLLGGALVVLGGVALAAAALAAVASGATWLVMAAGITGLGVALNWLASQMNFDLQAWLRTTFADVFEPKFWTDLLVKIRGFTAMLNQANDDVMNWAARLGASVRAGIANVWSGMTEGLNALINNIQAWFAGLPGRIWSSLRATPAPGAPLSDDPTITGVLPLSPSRLPPSSAPSDPRGTTASPLIVTVTNPTTGRDIRDGTAGYLGHSLSRTPASPTGADGRSVPNYGFNFGS